MIEKNNTLQIPKFTYHILYFWLIIIGLIIIIGFNYKTYHPKLKYIDYITIGCEVIVVDGSYMMDYNNKSIGADELEGKIFKVIKINTPLPTSNISNEILIFQNNCEIVDENNNIYYASLLNLRKK